MCRSGSRHLSRRDLAASPPPVLDCPPWASLVFTAQLKSTDAMEYAPEKDHNLPAVRHTTILGLNLMRTFKLTPWFRSLHTVLAVTANDKSDSTTANSPQSKLSDEETSLNLWEPLDGAMDSFHSLFEPNLLYGDAEGTQKRNHTSSIEPPTILRMPGSVKSFIEDSNSTTIRQTLLPVDLVLKDAGQNYIGLTPKAQQQKMAFTTPVVCLSGNHEMDPFSTLFPSEFPSDRAGRVEHPKMDTYPRTDAQSQRHMNIQTFGSGSLLPFRRTFSNESSTIADDTGGRNSTLSSMDIADHSSPDSSITSGEYCSSLSDSLDSSRRSSWATSIDALCEDDENTQSSLCHEKLAAEPDQTAEDLELLHEYQHYREIVDIGTPQHIRNKDFGAKQEATSDATKPETAMKMHGDLMLDMRGAIAPGSPKAPLAQAVSHAEEHMQPEDPPALDSERMSTPPPTPGEAAAWAHSYCSADPGPARLKVLTDDSGREFVLYHECFHCVPIELAPEFICVIEEEDDGYGSATGTCEATRVLKKLGTIQEEEEEG